MSYVNIVDARNFTSQQVIRVSPSHLDYHITGMDFAPDSRSMFVGKHERVFCDHCLALRADYISFRTGKFAS